jgi:chromosomal replication initiation ATPase DnaA
MAFEMKNLNQLILNFNFDQNFKDQDFYVSKSNEYSFKLLNSWPKWEKNFVNLIGDKFSGKTHLVNIFLEKFKGIKIEASEINNKFLKDIKVYENIIVENLNVEIDENIFFTLLNIIDQDNKYLVVTSKKPIVDFIYKLEDLNSRSKNFILSFIEKPEDDLMFALILKNLSDRQISIDKKLINFIIKRIDRSYGKIFDFIYKIDEISLKRKKPIDFKIIKEALGE